LSNSNNSGNVTAKEIVAFRVLTSLLWAREQGIQPPATPQQYDTWYHTYAAALDPVLDDAVKWFKEHRSKKKNKDKKE
jgi:hypothetical protein